MTFRMFRIGVVAATAMVLASAALFASGAKEGAQPESTGPAQITVWGWPAADKAFEAIYSGFQAKYPEITVSWVMKAQGASGVRDALTAALAAGSGLPDISMIEINDIDKFVLGGGFVNLLDPPYNAARFKDQFVSYKWKQATTLDGKRMLAFPWDIGPATIFYRRDLLQKAGVPSDPDSVAAAMKTWNDYVALGKKVNDPANKVFWTDNAANIPYIYFAHKNFFDANLNIAIDNAKTREVLQIAKQLRNGGMDLKTANWTDEWYAALNNGNVATTISGCWFGGFLKSWIAKDTSGKWGIAPIPEDPLQNWGGSFLAIPEKAANKAAAWKFIEYSMTTPEAQNAIFKAVDYFPALLSAYTDPLYNEPDPYFGGQKTRALWMKIAQSEGPFVTTALDAAAEDAFTAQLSTFLDQNLPVDTTITTMVQAIQKQTQADRQALLQQMGKQ